MKITSRTLAGLVLALALILSTIVPARAGDHVYLAIFDDCLRTTTHRLVNAGWRSVDDIHLLTVWACEKHVARYCQLTNDASSDEEWACRDHEIEQRKYAITETILEVTPP